MVFTLRLLNAPFVFNAAIVELVEEVDAKDDLRHGRVNSKSTELISQPIERDKCLVEVSNEEPREDLIQQMCGRRSKRRFCTKGRSISYRKKLSEAARIALHSSTANSGKYR
jgi:hypothetical protein